MLTDKEIQDAYIKYRLDPINDQFSDHTFCLELYDKAKEIDPEQGTIPLDYLKSLKTPDIYRACMRKVPSAEMFKILRGQTLRLCYDKLLNGTLDFKSFEGAVTAITSLEKQEKLDAGKPTEILEIAEKELASKTPKEKYLMLMDYLRRPSN